MRNLFDHHFTLKSGTKVYVPTDNGRKIGAEIKKSIERKWTAPSNYYHLRDGGHVAAARLHQHQPWVASVDLRRFFEQISRSRVQRSLLRTGFPNDEAFEMACNSVVDKNPPNRSFSIPFGFVQSPILASIVLAHSAMGSALCQIRNLGVQVSVYVDDITISGEFEAPLVEAMSILRRAAEISKFQFNEEKTQGPAPDVTSFNIHFGSGRMELIDDRMSQFELAIQHGSEWTISGILGYVETVNKGQASELSTLS